MDELIEHAFTFPANIWKKGKSQFRFRRLGLELAFKSRIAYYRDEGVRTAKITLPFKAL